MAGEERRDRRVWRTLLVLLAALVLVGAFVAWIVLPEVTAFYRVSVAPGIGLKSASVIAFFLTIALFVGLAVIAGDGLVGELEVLLSAFFGFFVMFTLLVAWVF